MAPDQRWSTDLCRVWGGRDGWLTLALVMDCHSREILGWQLSRSGKATTASAALEQAVIAVVDGLKGFPEAITAVFPDTVVQTCIVHLIRYAMQFASWKERKAIAKDLKPIYAAPSAEAAAAALDAFEEGPWGQKYPPIVASGRRNLNRTPGESWRPTSGDHGRGSVEADHIFERGRRLLLEPT